MGDEEVPQIRTRVYKLADDFAALKEAHALLNARVTALEAAVGKGATSLELSSAMQVLTLKIEGAERTSKAALDPIQKDVETIKKALYWFVGLVMAAVIGTVLALVLKP